MLSHFNGIDLNLGVVYMLKNRGATSLKTTRRARNPMGEYDRLPPQLRAWVSRAMLPWRAATVQRAYDKALARVGDPEQALDELDRLQRSLVTKDAMRIWGADHPDAERSA